LSNPVVGSSKNNILGLVTKSTATVVLFASPPDKPLVYLPPY